MIWFVGYHSERLSTDTMRTFLLLSCLVAAATAEVYFQEKFDGKIVTTFASRDRLGSWIAIRLGSGGYSCDGSCPHSSLQTLGVNAGSSLRSRFLMGQRETSLSQRESGLRMRRPIREFRQDPTPSSLQPQPSSAPCLTTLARTLCFRCVGVFDFHNHDLEAPLSQF